MNIPAYNAMTDKAEIIAFMKAYSFATIITVKDQFPTATPLPFTILERGDEIILTAHFSRANKQWEQLSDNTLLVIFSEPHAYISTKHYDGELNVPTWNYIAVHAYGKGEIVTDEKASVALLEKMIDNYDKDYQKQWADLPDDFKLKMHNGIVTFEIKVSDIQAKKKLSQNKTEEVKQRIIDTLEKSERGSEKLIADYMKKNKPAHK
jgi:transcriptional regulator